MGYSMAAAPVEFLRCKPAFRPQIGTWKALVRAAIRPPQRLRLPRGFAKSGRVDLTPFLAPEFTIIGQSGLVRSHSQTPTARRGTAAAFTSRCTVMPTKDRWFRTHVGQVRAHRSPAGVGLSWRGAMLAKN